MSRRDRWEKLRQDRLAAPAASAGYERARRAFELGEEIRALREMQRLSQSELARRMGSTQPAIARLEAGRVAPSLNTLDRAAAALGVELVIAASARKPTTALRCSFCGKHQRQVNKLIAGPDVYICNECVDLCVQIIAKERPKP